MKCARCDRPLLNAYVSDGPFSWGPKCAKAAGMTRPTGPRAPHPQPTEVDPRQLPLSLEQPKTARTGHRYDLNGCEVIAMEPGDFPLVATVAQPWVKDHRRVSAADLKPLPMAYFHGAHPT